MIALQTQEFHLILNVSRNENDSQLLVVNFNITVKQNMLQAGGAIRLPVK